MPRTRRVENLRHGARTTTAGTREGSTITVTASPQEKSSSLMNDRTARTHWGLSSKHLSFPTARCLTLGQCRFACQSRDIQPPEGGLVRVADTPI